MLNDTVQCKLLPRIRRRCIVRNAEVEKEENYVEDIVVSLKFLLSFMYANRTNLNAIYEPIFHSQDRIFCYTANEESLFN